MKPNGYPFVSAVAGLETENDTMVVFCTSMKNIRSRPAWNYKNQIEKEKTQILKCVEVH